MARRRLVFWQQIASIHQAAMLRALADSKDVDVVLVVDRETPEWRRSSGWFDVDHGGVAVVHNQDESATAALLRPHAADVHIFSGLRAAPRRAFLRARTGGALLGLYVETGDPRGVLGAVRRVVAAAEARRFRADIDFLLAVGRAGESWYRAAGYPAGHIHRFGYFVDTPPPVELSSVHLSPNLAFVGRLVHLKAIDVVLSALARLPDRPWLLNIVGDGPERVSLEQRASMLGIAQRIRFLGTLSNAEARAHIARADLVLLPSRKDGWGAVVNEALMSGVPVICSSACGAADLIGDDRGSVVRPDSVSSLCAALERWTRAPLTPQHRARIQAWSTRITGEAGARYLLEVLGYVECGGDRPQAPWLSP